mgnify:CR=1 FL=1
MKVLTYQQVVPPVPGKVNKVKYLGQLPYIIIILLSQITIKR